MVETQAKYHLGQVVRHKKYPFRGVIFDVDPIFDNTDEWYEAIPEDKVYIGATVELVDLKRDRELTYMLVAPEEADFEAGKISTTSPIG